MFLATVVMVQVVFSLSISALIQQTIFQVALISPYWLLVAFTIFANFSNNVFVLNNSWIKSIEFFHI